MAIKINNNVSANRSEAPNDLKVSRSELIEEIVSENPGFLLKWGNYFFLILLVLITCSLWIIKYPDIVIAEGKLTSINSPKPIISQINGKIVQLNIKESDVVESQQILGHLEALANHREVLALSSNLEKIQSSLDDTQFSDIKSLIIKSDTNFGELQLAHQTFIQAYITFENYLYDGFYSKKLELLNSDFQRILDLNNNLIDEKQLIIQDIELAQSTFETNETLKKENLISDFDFRIEKSKIINKKLAIPRINTAMTSNSRLQNERQREIIELKNTIDQQFQIFQQSINTFQSQIEEWRKRYLIIAPISGRVNFLSFLQENQQIEINQTICYIVPENTKYFAEVIIPQSNFGKVTIGQNVLLKFQSYPFQEFGSVLGKIEFISDIPTEGSGYLAKVNLVNGFTTTYGRTIQFRDGLTANAEIITKDIRLIERIFSLVKF